MSTQINVTVTSGDLSDKVKQLQQAARQEQVEKERQQRLEVQGTEQRKTKLEAEGRASDGSLLYGARFNQPQVEKRPAANRSSSGYPVATVLGGFGAPSQGQLTLWPNKQYPILSLTKVIPEIGVSEFVPPTGLGTTTFGESVTLYQRIRNFEQIVLPVGKETLIYCFYSNTAIGESTVTNESVTFENFSVEDGPNNAAHEIYFSAVANKSQIREITMPPLVRTAMEAQTPLMIWNPGTTYPINEFGGLGASFGAFLYPTGFPAGRENANLRFELGGNSSPSIFASFGLPTPTLPRFALAACQLDGTCVFDTINGGADPVGWDLTFNPDDDVPVYRKNKAASTVIPAGVTQYLTAWDWGRPSYCRSQLLALGFSAADLTP